MSISRATMIFIVVLCTSAGAVVINGGKGLPHTRAAWVSETGRLTILAHSRFWGKVGPLPSEGIQRAQTVWDVQGLVSLNYGIGDHFELSVTPIAYQDVHQGTDDEYPWDTFIGLKIGSFGSKANSLKYGVEIDARFPTGQRHNVVFEEYAAGKTEFGLNGLLSYSYDPLYPEDAFNMHLNFGYHHHNDVGRVLIEGVDPNKDPKLWEAANILHPSQQILYSLGFTIPTESFDYSLEWYGNGWLRKPPEAAASRENYLYMNAVVGYKPTRWFTFTVSGEYRLTSDKDETIGPRATPDDMPNYNTWRINLGAKFVLLPTSIYRTNERDILMQKAETRRELFEQIIRERRETESAEEELDRIKEERRKAERELERLRKILEGKADQREKLKDLEEKYNQ
ncbi:hypothetical protein JW935_07635 [candidate division KSB1 bacterium]|nr:hypothetical protein [candidate division KSB1 bacterium]